MPFSEKSDYYAKIRSKRQGNKRSDSESDDEEGAWSEDMDSEDNNNWMSEIEHFFFHSMIFFSFSSDARCYSHRDVLFTMFFCFSLLRKVGISRCCQSYVKKTIFQAFHLYMECISHATEDMPNTLATDDFTYANPSLNISSLRCDRSSFRTSSGVSSRISKNWNADFPQTI